MPAGDMLTYQRRATDDKGYWYGINRDPHGSVWWDAAPEYPRGYMGRESDTNNVEYLGLKIPCITRPTA